MENFLGKLGKKLDGFVCKDPEILEDLPELANPEEAMDFLLEEGVILYQQGVELDAESEKKFDEQELLQEVFQWLVTTYKLEKYFVIDSPSKADWALAKIKDAYRRLELFIEVSKEKIETLKLQMDKQAEKVENEVAYLKSALLRYMSSVPCKETKTQYSLELPSGKLLKKKPRLDYKYDQDDLLSCLDEEYLKISEKVDWSKLKKDLTIINGKVCNKNTGEIYEKIGILEIPERLEFK